jgi:hypothetical protein
MKATAKHLFVFIYQTTNLINGKIYIGVHATNKMNDGYIGCGLRCQYMANYHLKRGKPRGFVGAVIKHGYRNFKMEPIEFFNDLKEAYVREAEIVNADFVKRKDTYNLRTGGLGGMDTSQKSKHKCRTKEILKLYREDCLPIVSISTLLNINTTSVRNIIKSNTEIRPSGFYNLKKVEDCKEEVIKMFLNGATKKLLVKKFKVSYQTLDLILSDVKPDDKHVAVSPSKEISFFTNVTKFARDNGDMNPTGIRLNLIGKTRHYKNWMFFYKKNWDGRKELNPLPPVETLHKGVKFLTKSGSVLEVEDSLYNFCRVHNFSYDVVLKVTNKKLKTYRGMKLYEENCQVL